MQDLDVFHDGAFEGLLIDNKTIHLFLSTDRNDRFVLSADGVVALRLNNVQLGNIILDVEEQVTSELTLRDIYDVFQFAPTPSGEAYAEKALAMAQREGLSLLCVNPSDGASCLLLAKAITLRPRREWIAAP
jgi:hypothetical protein